jgi:hypothetical protein
MPTIFIRQRKTECKKSDTIYCLEDEANTEDTNPLSDVVVLNGAAIVNMLKQGSAKTFQDFANGVFL